jgi:hypothetical protein
LILAPTHANMGSHIMKTTIEIADDLFERVQSVARRDGTTFRSLTEQGLRLVLKEKWARGGKLPPLVTVRGEGLTSEFRSASWDRIRDEIYRARGA